MNVDFYGALGNDGKATDLIPALIAASKMKPASRLKYRNPLYSDFLESAKLLSDGSLQCTVARVRMKGLPGRFDSASFKLGHLDLNESDGVSEEVHILVDNQLQTVALQRNGHFRSTQVEVLLQELTQLPFTLEPKVRADVWKRLQSFDHIGSIDVRLKEPSFHPDFSDSVPSVEKLIDEVSGIAQLSSIEIVFKMKKGASNPQDANLLKKFLRTFRNQSNTTRLTARGTAPKGSKTEPVDLLRDRIVASGEVEYSEGRRLDGMQCRSLLRTALSKNQELLRTLLITAD